MPLTTIAAGPALRSVLNTNFSYCVLKDVAATITVTHIWSASQTFSAGFTVAGTITCTASGVLFSRNAVSTAIQYCQIINTTGGLAWGIEGSAGSALIVGAAAYDAVFRSKQGGIAFSTDDGATLHARLTAAGLTTAVPVIAPAATTSIPSLRAPHGSAPSAPTNGDIWTTTAGLFVRINGATVGPLS